MNKENEEIKSQVIKSEIKATEETKKEEKPKFKQEKIKVEKPKKKTWKKVFWAIVITLIIGIIGGGVGLYYLQEKTDFWFIVPSTLTKKVEIKNENTNKNETSTNKTTNTTTEEPTKQEVTILTMDEAYKKLDELYKIGIEFYLNYPVSYFTVDDKSHPTTSETAVEITDYDKIINKYFTKSAKADYEEGSANIIIEENDKTFMESAKGVIGLDYLDRIFTKIEISENEITCEVNNIYNGSFDDMKVTSDGSITLDTMNIKLEQVKSKFVIKKVNDNWKIEEFDFDGMR